MRRKGSKIRRVLFACVAVAAILGAGLQPGCRTAQRSKSRTMVSIPKMRVPWFDRMEVGLKNAGADFNIEVSQQAPAAPDEAQQVRLIEDAINQGNDALFLVPNDAKSIEPVLARAAAREIITITHESPNQKNADFDIEMIDNVAFGGRAMDLLVESKGTAEGEYVIFVGSLTVPAHNVWADAAIASARRKYPDLKQIGDRYPVSEDQNAARQTALDIITAHPNCRAFLCFGSQGAPGAAQAVREKGLIGKVTVVGNTLPSQASQYLKDGSLSICILWDPAEAAYAAGFIARLLFDGKRSVIGPDLEIPKLGKPRIFNGNTLVYDRPLIVTKENVDQFRGF